MGMGKAKSYVVYLANDAGGKVRKICVPQLAVHLTLLAALIGVGTVLVGITSYAHILVKMNDYDRVSAERHNLRTENRSLQAKAVRSREKLVSLESLADEVAVSLGLLRLRYTPFGSIETAALPSTPESDYRDSLARFRYLRHHATAVKLYASGVPVGQSQDIEDLRYIPSLWPVRGPVVSGFGQRIDPFNGEGAFHKGVDIDGNYGDAVRTAADGFVIWAGSRAGFGRLVIVDHGGGVTTYYAHLSRARAYSGQSVERGDIIGFVGSTGRAKGSHLHYEVRLNRSPLNPWRFLRTGSVQTAQSRPTVFSGSSD